MYEAHGMSSGAARTAATEVMASPDAALRVHTREELGVDPNELGSPWSASVLSLACFLFGALLPVVPWLVSEGNGATIASIIIGLTAAAVVGWLVGRFAERPPMWSAARQMMIMIVAAGATYAVGRLLGVSVS
jgi:VIT1/CCC1 family predicted Fe2+/Mn2+ transporter